MGASTAENGAEENFPWGTTITALVFAFLALARGDGWAQGATNSQLDTIIQERIQRLGDKNPKVRYEAVTELGADGPIARAAVPALEIVLAKDTDVTVRRKAAGALGSITRGLMAESLVPALSAALATDGDATVREAAAWGLLLGGPTAEPALRTALTNDKSEEVRQAAADVLGQKAPRTNESLIALSTALAKDTSEKVRESAAHALTNPYADPKVVVPALSASLATESEKGVRRADTEGLGQFGLDSKSAAPVLAAALDKDRDVTVQRLAATALGRIGPGAKEVVPSLSAALIDGAPDEVRIAAAEALRQIGPGAKGALSALIVALSNDTDELVRGHAAATLGLIGPDAKPAVPALKAALTKDSEQIVRELAAQSLGQIGLGAVDAAAELKAALATDPSKLVRTSAADALVQFAQDARDSERTDMIGQLTQWAQSLKTANFPDDSDKVSKIFHLLKDYEQWYRVLYEMASKHLGWTGLAAAYLALTLLWLALLWITPLAIWRINEILVQTPKLKVKLPGWLGEMEISVASLLLVGFFHYHSRVLDAWVSKRVPAARDQFGKKTTVQERAVHIEVPVELDRIVIPGLRPEDLRKALARNSARLLIWGEGGAGKTSLACQIALWSLSDDVAMRPCGHRMLPIMIEQDMNLEIAQGRSVLIEVIRGELRNLTREAKAPDQEMVRHLLSRKRILLIVDGLSELNEATRNKVRLIDPEFAANALIVTSRIDETLDSVEKATLHPMRIQGDRLSSFMGAYLERCGKRALFKDAEFFVGCSKLSVMVGDRDTTVLLAKLYAEQMIGSKEGAEQNLPENLPDLMLRYLNRLNRKTGGLEDRVVHSAAKIIAWECLKETFRPTPAKLEEVLAALDAETAQNRLDYLEKTLRLVQVIGEGRDHLKFALDPLAEYLAGLHVVERYSGNERLWREFLDKADKAPGVPSATKGFLLAVRDCCIARGGELKVPSFVSRELARRAGVNVAEAKLVPSLI